MGKSLLLRRVRAMDRDGDFPGLCDILAEEGRITRRGRDLTAPREAEVVDCDGGYLMPGVFDCHVHAGMRSDDTWENLNKPYSLRVLETADNLGILLRSGVTWARDAGGTDVGVPQALRAGLIQGPALQVSVALLCQTGGHMDTYLPGEDVSISTEGFMPAYPGRPKFRVDGVDEMRRAVRQVLRAGADWVKLCTTGGIFSGVNGALTPQLSQEEVDAAVFEADKAGKPVMVHAVGGEGATWAIRAGARSLEHGVYLTEEQVALMGQKGTFLVPTLAAYHRLVDLALLPNSPLPPPLRESAKRLDAQLGQSVRMAHSAGVPIALGTDTASLETHGRSLEEIYFLCKAGLSVEEALVAATRRGAELCGCSDSRGQLSPGFALDAILLRGDPSDPAIFRKDDVVQQVYLAGQAVGL